MQIAALLEAFFDEHPHWSAVVDGRGDFAQPYPLAVVIPARNLPGQGFGPTVAQAFGHYMVVLSKQPAQLIVGSTATVKAPDRPAALVRS